MKQDQKLFESGKFFTGCNYWASHAGTNMWHDWSAETVEADFARLAEAGIAVLRVFPLWSDFQPLRMHRFAGGGEKELRLYEEPLPHTEAGAAGIDVTMADRFETFCDLAGKYGMKLIVGLITGWMSGRMYMPEAFAGRDLITDPMVVRWQIRYVRYMVRRFKNHPAIAAWDLGNECNCMQQNVSRDAAFVWASTITNAIRVEDTAHPVVSGMHGLRPEGSWTAADQGEALDILCTHPYPIFTPHCDTDPINEMKTVLHSTAESVMSADLGGKPCFVEEAGTLGPMISNEEVAASYVRSALFSAWAHDLRGFVWWCANEQAALEHTPYDWCAVERELGLFRMDGTPKPVLGEMSAFTRFADGFPYGTLPPCLSDAVCILTEDQDTWAAAYGAYLLGKQAGLDLHFAWCLDRIPESPVYMLPALTGNMSIERHVLLEILDRVKDGAVLYLSLNDALLSPFSEITGVRVKTRSRRIRPDTVTLGGTEFSLTSPYKLVLEPVGAKVLASAADGSPALSVFSYGKGKIYFCAYPIELIASCHAGVISGDDAVPLYRFYEAMKLQNPERTAKSDSPVVAVTEHIVSDAERLVTVLNHSPKERTAKISLKAFSFDSAMTPFGGTCEKTEEGFFVTLPANTGLVAVIKK